MSKIHIQKANNRKYDVVVHTPMPSGSNTAGETWKDCWVADGKNLTVLKVGTKPSNITQAESNGIIAGDTMELSTTVLAESGGTAVASLNELVDTFIIEEKKKLKNQYKYFGYSQ